MIIGLVCLLLVIAAKVLFLAILFGLFGKIIIIALGVLFTAVIVVTLIYDNQLTKQWENGDHK